MRLRSGRYLFGLALLGAGYGCYSSFDGPPTIGVQRDGGSNTSSGNPSPGPDKCTPRKPWEGPGVTGILPMAGTDALVFSGDLYWKAKLNLASIDDPKSPTLGTIAEWNGQGRLSELFHDAPLIDGVRLWDEPGVTAAFLSKNKEAVIISHHLRWRRTNETWGAKGPITEEWIIADAGPPLVEGEAPWTGPGVTAGYFSVSGNSFYAFSGSRVWERQTVGNEEGNWQWLPEGGANVSASAFWSAAPPVGGQKPFDGKGITATLQVGQKLLAYSGDRVWAHDGSNWRGASQYEGMLASLAVWSSAPDSECP